jgi:Na+-translocating ferredoxin:NAD+ oxidoreductase subunit B
MDLADQIDDLLPQTQCTQCGYSGCRPYAEAIACGAAQINQCPPGGAHGIAKLAALLGRDPLPLSPGHGVEKPLAAALIDEQWCIGCTLCIHACPVDAIVGAAKRMHTVLLAQCTGCELCIAPCPVDCIEMVPVVELIERGAGIRPSGPAARESKARYLARQARLAREREPNAPRMAATPQTKSVEVTLEPIPTDTQRKRAAVEAALARARARRDAS